jgi:hypothetical protein
VGDGGRLYARSVGRPAATQNAATRAAPVADAGAFGDGAVVGIFREKI